MSDPRETEMARAVLNHVRRMGNWDTPEATERQRKAIEAARVRAKNPEPPPDPNLPKWWEGLDKPE